MKALFLFLILCTVVGAGYRSPGAVPPANDAFISPALLRGEDVVVTGATTDGATAEPGEPAPGGEPAARSLWWFWAAPARGEVLLDMTATPFAYRVALYRGKDFATLASIPVKTDPALPHLFRSDVEGGGEVLLWVDGRGAASGPVGFRLRLIRTPEILSPPRAVSVYEGQRAVFQVTAAGRDLDYQWLFRDAPLGRGTGSVLEFSRLTASQAGDYRVIVSNPLGAVTSAVARLTVHPSVPLPEALDTPGREWRTGGTVPWFGQSEVTQDGSDAARSGIVSAGFETSYVETTIDGPVRVSFAWSLTGGGNDEMTAQLDRTPVRSMRGTLSWQRQNLDVPAGRHVVRWEYRNDDKIASTTDGAVLDQIQLLPVAPSWVTQPRPVTACPGASVLLEVDASGTPPLGYRWFRNGTAIPDAFDETLPIENLTPLLAGEYLVRVSNSAGFVDSSPVRVGLRDERRMPLDVALDLVAITMLPASRNPWFGQDCENQDGIDAGRSAAIGDLDESAMAIEVKGPGVADFWWRVSSQAGADRLVLHLDDLEVMQISGEQDWERQTVRVSEGTHRIAWRYRKDGAGASGQDAGWVDRVAFRVDAPSLTGPEDVDACEGARVVLEVEAEGFPPIRYQWQKNGSDMLGQTGPSLTFPTVRKADAGSYRVIARNSVGSSSSREVRLRVSRCVTIPDAVDTPAWVWETGGSQPWTGQDGVTHDGLDAARSGRIGGGESTWVETVVEGPGLLAFWWMANAEECCDLLEFELDGSKTAQAKGTWEQKVIQVGEGRRRLRWIYSKDSSYVAGEDAGFLDGVSFRPIDTPPEILRQPPTELLACTGSIAELSIEATGKAPLRYEWFRDGVSVGAGSGPVLTVTNVTAAHGGTYTVRVSSSLGVAESGPARLRILRGDGIPFGEALDAPDIHFSTGGSLEWKGQECTSHDGVDAVEAQGGAAGSAGWIEARLQGPGHLSFWWWLEGEFGDRLTLEIDGSTAASNRDDGDKWKEVKVDLKSGEHPVRWKYERSPFASAGTPGAVRLDEVSYVEIKTPPRVITEPPGRLSVCEGAPVEIVVEAEGTPPLTYQWFRDGLPIEGASASLTLAVVRRTDAGVYHVEITNAHGEAISRQTVLNVLPNAGIPLGEALDTRWSLTSGGARAWFGQACVTHDGADAAQGGRIEAGQESSMDASVEGPGSLAFWWMLEPDSCCSSLEVWVDSRRAASATRGSWRRMSLELASGTHQLSWRFRKDSFAPTEAGGAWVDELSYVPAVGPPIIVENPSSVTACEGDATELHVLAGGQPPLSYQWLKNDVPLEGKTSSSLPLARLTASDDGDYSVQVRNAQGAIVSGSATVDVRRTSGIALAEALDATGSEFTTSPGVPWIGGACISHDGIDAARIPDGDSTGKSWMETRVQGPGRLSFWWRLDGQTFDQLRLRLNDLTQATLRPGRGEWKMVDLDIPDGLHVLRWEHDSAPSSGSSGRGAWVDEVSYRPTAIAAQILEPLQPTIRVCAGVSVTLAVRAVGTSPIDYVWFKDGLVIPNARAATLTHSNITVGDSGEYRVRVANALGQQTSAPSRLDVTPRDGIPLGQSLERPEWSWSSSGPIEWVGQACESHDGIDAAALWEPPAGSQVTLTARVPGPGRLSFWWRLDAGFFDSLRLESGGRRWADARSSGEWQEVSVDVPIGLHDFQWVANRSDFGSGPRFAAWLDEVRWTPSESPPGIAPLEPADISVCPGESVSLLAGAWGFPAPGFRWLLNGKPLAVPSLGSLIIPSAGAGDAGRYQLVVSNRLGAATSRVATVVLRDCIPLPDALDAADLTWRTGGDAPWFGQRRVTRNPADPDAGQSGPISHRQQSWVETEVDGPGTLSFSWRMSSDVCCDRLEFLLDEVAKYVSFEGWSERRFPITVGRHTLRWRYSKDASTTRGDDAGWLDLVKYERDPTAPIIVIQPVGQAGVPGGGATFRVQAKGYPTLRYQWMLNGEPISGAENPQLELTTLATKDIGIYTVVVSNSVGAVVSDPARLTFGGIVQGLVKDATNKRPIPGAIVRAGERSATTDTNGNYSLFDVQAGQLLASFRAENTRVRVREEVQFRSQSRASAIRLSANADGFDPWETLLDVPPGGRVEESIDLSPELFDGVRMVLNWGEDPVDLDAHLRAPAIDGECFEVFHLAGYRGAYDSAPFAALDVDVKSGFGPETITIRHLQDGIYRYFVKKAEGGQELAGSGAEVRIYTRDGLFRGEPIVVPGKGEGAFWHVCDIVGSTGDIQPVNQIMPVDPGSPCLGLPSPTSSILALHQARRSLHSPRAGLTHRWDFGDGEALSNAEDPAHPYRRPGKYTVSLTVSDASGRIAAEVRTNYIDVVDEPPTVDLIPAQMLAEDGPLLRLPLSVHDAESPSERLTVKVSAEPARLFVDQAITIESSDAGRGILIRPARDEFGSAIVRVVVEDEALQSVTNAFTITIQPVNDPPHFVPGPDIVSDATSGTVNHNGWAQEIRSGPPNEGAQSLVFWLTNDNPSLFRDQPAVSVDGTLSFTPSPDANGMARVTVMLEDDGGRSLGGTDTSPVHSFQITIRGGNRPPSIDPLGPVVLFEDRASDLIPVVISDPDTPGSQLRLTASTWDAGLLRGPGLQVSGEDTRRTLRITPATDAYGEARVFLVADDGTESVGAVLLVTVLPVNDRPTFFGGGDIAVNEDSGAATRVGWADAIQAGPPNESGQSLTFNVTNDNPGLFAKFPALDASGTLTFTPSPNAFGTARVTVVLRDDGGTTNGGVEVSQPYDLQISVQSVNDPPSISGIADLETLENTPTPRLSFTVRDIETPAAQLLVTGSTSNPTLVPDANVALRGDGIDRTVTITPAPGRSGTARITLEVRDQDGATASTSFVITVKRQTAAPTVRITSPTSYATFKPDIFRTPPSADLDIEAEAVAGTSAIAKVDFYAGSALIGTASAPPYRIHWSNVPVGDYRLTAFVTGTSGLTAESPPVNVSVSDLAAEVAIIRNYDDPEITQLRDYLLEMGLSSRVFDQEGLNTNVLSYQLIIWAGLSRTGEGITDNNVTLLTQAFARSIPLYLMGDHLLSDTSALSRTRLTEWMQLIRLTSVVGSPVETHIDVAPFVGDPDQIEAQPGLMNGRFGLVEDFTYPMPVDRTALPAGNDGQVVGKADGADWLVAYPNRDLAEPGRVRSFTQLGRVWTGGNDAGAQNRKKLFQNVVCWLRECSHCGALKLKLEVEGPVGTVAVGQSIIYALKVSQAGECEATGVIVKSRLPAEIRDVEATSERGTVEILPNEVVFRLGHLASADEAAMQITFVPMAPGPAELCATVSGNNETADATNTQCVTNITEGAFPAKLSVTRAGPASIELRLSADRNGSYTIQRSANLRDWTSWRPGALGPDWKENIPTDGVTWFYRIAP